MDDIVRVEDYGESDPSEDVDENVNNPWWKPKPEAGEDDYDLNNYKGIYFNDEPGSKFTDPITGAHFEYNDMCSRLTRLRKLILTNEQEESLKMQKEPKTTFHQVQTEQECNPLGDRD